MKASVCNESSCWADSYVHCPLPLEHQEHGKSSGLFTTALAWQMEGSSGRAAMQITGGVSCLHVLCRVCSPLLGTSRARLKVLCVG